MSNSQMMHEKVFKPVITNFFSVTFFMYSEDVLGGMAPLPRVPSPTDIRFQRISGLGGSLNVTRHYQGGGNVHAVDLPETVQRDTLVMERGIMLATPFSSGFNDMLSDGKVFRNDIVIMLWAPVAGVSTPLTTWIVQGAIPVRWSMGEYDANANQIAINRFELSYHKISSLAVNL
ncbi:TPA: phage tail protein [Enterobacter bugandensis]|nr:phage tail protein [Enterobacter bugandensis]